MTWNPGSNERFEQVNITDTIASRNKPPTGTSSISSKFRSSDGKTSEWEFPEVAPLVFPALDQLAAQTSKEGVQKKNRVASSMAFVANYWDKRATAEYVSLESRPSCIPQASLSFACPELCIPANSVCLLSRPRKIRIVS